MPPPGTITFNVQPDMEAALKVIAGLRGTNVSEVVRESCATEIRKFRSSGEMERLQGEAARALRDFKR